MNEVLLEGVVTKVFDGGAFVTHVEGARTVRARVNADYPIMNEAYNTGKPIQIVGRFLSHWGDGCISAHTVNLLENVADRLRQRPYHLANAVIIDGVINENKLQCDDGILKLVWDREKLDLHEVQGFARVWGRVCYAHSYGDVIGIEVLSVLAGRMYAGTMRAYSDDIGD